MPEKNETPLTGEQVAMIQARTESISKRHTLSSARTEAVELCLTELVRAEEWGQPEQRPQLEVAQDKIADQIVAVAVRVAGKLGLPESKTPQLHAKLHLRVKNILTEY